MTVKTPHDSPQGQLPDAVCAVCGLEVRDVTVTDTRPDGTVLTDTYRQCGGGCPVPV